MKKEGTIGAAAFLAIAAAVGVSLQTGSNHAENSKTDGKAASKRPKVSVTKHDTDKERPGCGSLATELEDFLGIENLILPEQCYGKGGAPAVKVPKGFREKTANLKFVIAFMPDPVHTHSSVLFDRFAEAIQEGAQDDGYHFDSALLPWDDDEASYARLADEKASSRERQLKEAQPGIILFRKQPPCVAGDETCKVDFGRLYSGGLIVFVVGEDATHGVHREQFFNALGWIAALQSKTDSKGRHLAILGPTFSGSFPSLARALKDPTIARQLDLDVTPGDRRLAIFSGTVSGRHLAQSFQDAFRQQVVFHSFVQDDESILSMFCKFITNQQPGFDASRFAIVSEDETAYGGAIQPGSDNVCMQKALRLYYPRDISALRAAYQTKSLFGAGTPAQPAEAQRRNLPTDLADPTGKVHDSIRSYGGGQTPLAQEAHLMEIVAALRELRARYILIRSSNTLDQLFLANFFRRTYPDGRIVFLGSDLMFVRERGSTGLSGAMTLSTYPLFPLERDWTEHQSAPAADRTFGTDTSEGTYVAFRLVLNDKSMNDNDKPDPARCHVDQANNEKEIFLPSILCGTQTPIPDYSPPFWTLANQCGEMKEEIPVRPCLYPGPATWLSVIGANGFWPLASLTKDTPKAPIPNSSAVKVGPNERNESRKDDPGGLPVMPVGMKVFLLALAGFAVFHAWCCWFGSYTAKPIFLAHFASTGDWHHTWLVFGASCCLAFSALVAGWGCGVFAIPTDGLPYPWFAFGCVAFAWLMAGGALLANSHTSRELSKSFEQAHRGAAKNGSVGSPSPSNLPRWTQERYIIWNYMASVLFVVASALFCLSFVVPVERALLIENRVLTYWRAMHLASGLSPIVPIFSVFVGLYLSHWLMLHGLALFGPDRPCLPPGKSLALKDVEGNSLDFLRMFSQEDAADRIERAAAPWDRKIAAAASGLVVLFAALAFATAGGVPIRSLGSQNYAIIFLVWLDICCSLLIVETYRLYHAWEELRQLLTFLDRVPLRRTFASLHGISWGSVWKMSGNVLEVRYKVMSRQLECMNHTITRLEEFLKTSGSTDTKSLEALFDMRQAGTKFARWYSRNYSISRAGDLRSFQEFQKSVAAATGTLFSQLLVPAWRNEGVSLLVWPKDEKEEPAPNPPPLAKEAHIRNAEEFVCLGYLGFIQNVLGRLRTMALTVIALFLTSAVAMSSYPFDPRQPLSAALIALFVIAATVIVNVYAGMHRDATLSYVTNTKPGQLGSEFWFKILGFGFAPLIGVLTRIFPGITDFIFSWLQPGVSSLK